MVDSNAKKHKLVAAAVRILKEARPDEKGILALRYDVPCLEIRVSKGALERTLIFLNALILWLEAEGFPVAVNRTGMGQEPRSLDNVSHSRLSKSCE